MVKSQIIKANGEPVKVEYMMRRNGEDVLRQPPLAQRAAEVAGIGGEHDLAAGEA
jgi:hypothetical protein